jgi:hypothetical protein
MWRVEKSTETVGGWRELEVGKGKGSRKGCPSTETKFSGEKSFSEVSSPNSSWK